MAAQSLFQQGCDFHQRGLYEKALACFDRVVAKDPGHAQAHLNRGVVLLGLSRWPDAVMSLTQSLALDASSALAWSNLGVALKNLRQFHEALNCFDQALAREPSLVMALNNRGVVLRDLLQFDEAIASHRQAIALQPELVSAWNNLGLALKEAGRIEEALVAFDRALELEPAHALAWANKGVTLQAQQQSQHALVCYERALALRPDWPDLLWNQSHALLSLGEFEAGWHLFESRWTAQGTGMRLPHPVSRQWQGQDPAGKTILVYHEQGLGDSLQFCRYLPGLAQRGATVLLQVPPALTRLMRSLPGVTQVIERGQDLPAFDWHCPMMSLPLCMGAAPLDSAWSAPYLQADPLAVDAWTRKLGPRRRPRVGLVWSGGFRPDQPELHATNQRRNLPLHVMAGILRSDLEFYSLQKGEAAERELQEAAASVKEMIIDHTDSLHDFAETAALVAQLDLVISVDTSTAHLAAAMGKPVWLLNRFDSCWRWRLSPVHSPWYPTLRLFNQPRGGDWLSVMDEVGRALDQTLPCAHAPESSSSLN